MSDYVKIDAIVLAGERPGGDPLAAHFDVAFKAIILVAGTPMVERVAAVLRSHPAIASVRVLGPGFEPSGATIATTLRPLIARAQGPLLVTTADHALLDAAMLDSFLGGARGHDLAVGLVERRTLLAAYPESRRTWLKFRGGAYSGANLFWIGGTRVLPVLDVWARVEQQRKRGRALIGAFGPMVLAGVALRLLTLEGALARVGRRFGLSIAPIVLPQAEACIDVDSVADHALVEAILAAR